MVGLLQSHTYLMMILIAAGVVIVLIKITNKANDDFDDIIDSKCWDHDNFELQVTTVFYSLS